MAEYDINLNHLTAGEYLSFKDSFNDYRKVVLAMLNINNDFLFEDDLLKEYENDSVIKSEGKEGKPTMEKILESFPDRFVRHGAKPKIKGKREFTPVWFDIWTSYVITPKDFLFDCFFIYKIRQTDILEIDNLLNYSLEKYYSGKTAEFIRFLKLAVRKHGKKLLQPEHTETITEWIDLKERKKDTPVSESGQVISGTKEGKEKFKRERTDKATDLTLEQTSLLAYFLSKSRIILPMGKLYHEIDNAEIGKALAMLTRFNADKLRQCLSEKEINSIADKKNLDAVQNLLQRTIKKIDDKRQELKDPKKGS